MAGATWLRAVFVMCVLGLVLLFPGRADAACHSFTVAASPSTVAEGGKVTVTVTRDAAVNPSDVYVTTVNGSATAPSDYAKLDAHVQMTSETSKTYSIAIKDDTATEGAETFKVHLHDPGGCAVRPTFELGPDAKVTIKASDSATPPPAAQPSAPAATVAAQASASAPPVASPTVEATVTTTPSPSAETTFAPQAAEETGGGLPAGAIAGIVVGALAVAAGGTLLWMRRRSA